MEVVIYKQEEMVDGRISVVYLIRNNADVHIKSALLPAGTNPIAYGKENAEVLFEEGTIPKSQVSPIALFKATANRSAKNIHLGAIFSAFQQLAIGGSLPDMKISAKQVYATSDAEIAQLNAFINAYKNASQEDRDELLAIAIYAIGSLTTMA